MSQWESRISGSPVWERLRSAQAQLDQITVSPEDPAEVSADITRLRTVVQTVESRLKSADPLLLHPGPLGSMDTKLAELLTEIAAFQSNRNRGHLASANDKADSILAYAAQLPLVASAEHLEEAQSAIAAVRERSEQVVEALYNQEGKLREQLGQLSQQVDATTREVTSQKARLDSAIAEYQKQFSTAEQARQSQSTDAQRARDQRIDQAVADAQKQLQDALSDAKSRLGSTLQEASTKSGEQNEALVAAGKKILDNLGEFRSKAENLLHVIGSTGMAGEYQKVANSGRRASITWQVIAAFAMVGLIFFAIQAYYATQTEDFRWGGVATRAFVAVTFGVLAAYAARQSDRYSEVEVRNRRYQLELSSIDPYLANLPKDVQQKVKLELAQKLFGNAANPALSTTASRQFSGTGKDPLELALSIVADLAKK